MRFNAKHQVSEQRCTHVYHRSNDYSTSLDPKTSLKAVLLNKVVVGKGYKMTQDNTSLTAPPAGFDSVNTDKDIAAKRH